MPHSTATTTTSAPERRSFESRTPSMKFPTQTLERFPDHDESISTPGLTQFHPSPVKQNGYSNRQEPPDQRWLPRIDSGIQMNGPWKGRRHTGVSRHARQPSLSDALKTIRTGTGSVSSNAHEIADALKAPVSPRLIVWYCSNQYIKIHADPRLDTLYYMVLLFRSDQYFIEIYFECFSQACDPHAHSVCIGRRFLLFLLMACKNISCSPERNSFTSKWHTISDARNNQNDFTIGSFSNWWPSPKLDSNCKDPSVSSSHH